MKKIGTVIFIVVVSVCMFMAYSALLPPSCCAPAGQTGIADIAAAISPGALSEKTVSSKIGGDFYAENDSRLIKDAKLDVGTRKMSEKLGADNIYPRYYKAVKEYELAGASESEARKQTSDSIIRQEALLQYAAEHHLTVSEKMLKKRMNDELKDMKTADNYGEYVKAYKCAGSSFEKEYLKNTALDYVIYTDDNVYRSFIKNHTEKEWTTFQHNVIKTYCRSQDYRTLSRALEVCKIDMMKYGTNTEGLKQDADVLNVYDCLSYRG